MKNGLLMLIVALVASVVFGCATHNQTKLNKDGIEAITSVANTAMLNPDGTLRAAFTGVGPSQVNQDAGGNYFNMPGPVGIISAPMPWGEGVGFIVSPKDTEIASIKYTPVPEDGQPMIEVRGVKANISGPIEMQTAALTIAMVTLDNMVKTEAFAQVEKWREAGVITANLAKTLVDLIASGVLGI